MLLKNILVFVVLVILSSQVIIAEVCSTDDLRAGLKKSLVNFLTDPSGAELSAEENRDLLVFYLSIPDTQVTADCSNTGSESGMRMNEIMHKINTRISDSSSVCNDGTSYSTCSLTKPEYCYNGELIDKCTICGCNEGQMCENNECVDLNVACNIDSDCGENHYLGNQHCVNGNIYQDYITRSCDNKGTLEANCTSRTTDALLEICQYGCSEDICMDSPECGNDLIGPEETCDGSSMNGETCQSQGFHSGNLGCLNDCSGYNTSNCISNPACDSCEDCDTIFSSCTYQECNQDCNSGAGCYYKGDLALVEDCVDIDFACNNLISSCEDYTIEECNSNPCNIGEGCYLKEDNCTVTSEPGCGDGTCDVFSESCYVCALDCGECSESRCFDSDDLNVTNRGFTLQGMGTMYDYCDSDSGFAVEQYCISGNEKGYQKIECPQGLTCDGGLCLNLGTGKTGHQITETGNNPPYMPSVYGAYIIYLSHEWGVSFDDIYLYDISTGATTQITHGGRDKKYPKIFGDIIVWQDHRESYPTSGGGITYSGNIYMYDLSSGQETPVTRSLDYQFSPDVWGTIIVWQNKDANGNYDIYMCDISLNGQEGGCLTNDIKTRVTSDLSWQLKPKIYGSRIVWQNKDANGNYDIYMCDISLNGQEGGCLPDDLKMPVSTKEAKEESHDIYGDIVVWHDDSAGAQNLDIYMYDISKDSTRQITSDPSKQKNPVVHGDKIAWQDLRNDVLPLHADYDIYVYDIPTGTEKRITCDYYSQEDVEIQGDKIVWEDFDASTPASTMSIFYYNLDQDTSLC